MEKTQTDVRFRYGAVKTRRQFLQRAAALGGVAALADRLPRAVGGAVSGANARLGVGFIGVGGRGSGHVGVVQGLIGAGEPVAIVAVNDAYGPRMRAAAEKTGAKAYRTHHELLADPAVDVVCVGDAQLDSRLSDMVAAAREAMVNAAKHAGGAISVYAEVEDARVTVFVRDRGQGFDPDDLPADRLGVRESIIGRMQRCGGTATIRSGESGTEVGLELPR